MNEPTPKQRLWAALPSGGIGLWLAYVVWSRQPGLLVPPVVGYLAAAAFGAGAVLTGLIAVLMIRATLRRVT
jgi:hypothetical protein